MEFIQSMSFIYEGLISIGWQQWVMYAVGLVLIYLAIKKEYEPSLLLPMGFGAIPVSYTHLGNDRRLPEYLRRQRLFLAGFFFG